MTEADAAALDPKSGEYIQIWADNFSQVTAQIAGSAVPCQVRPDPPPDLPPAGQDDLWALVTSSGGLRGEMSLRLLPATVLRLAQIFMSEPEAPETPLTADHRDAVIELLRQVSGTVATDAKARWGEVQLRIEPAAAAPSWPPAETFWLQTGAEGATGMVLEFGLSAALVAELRAEKVEAAKTQVDSSSPVPPADSGEGTGALNRLMDVQLAVTMRFGSRQLLLREVLDLSPGAVVELDRRIQEPVDLLLDGRLLARGEVVVIDGNYGLRVTDISPLATPTGQHDE
ncbi:MAG: FliM/FliN family flagellar motor switch protein [Candidatus Sulfotelmatobacter sp.]